MVEEGHWVRKAEFIATIVDENTSSYLRSVLGLLDTRVFERTDLYLSEGGQKLVVKGESSMSLLRMSASTEFVVTNGKAKMKAEAKYTPSGYADRLIASTIEKSAIARAEHAFERFWHFAKLEARVVSPVTKSGGLAVQRVLKFNEDDNEDLEYVDDEEEGTASEDDANFVFEDAVSMHEVSTLTETRGFLSVLERETLAIGKEIEMLRERRCRIEMDALEKLPSNPTVPFVRFLNSKMDFEMENLSKTSTWISASQSANTMLKKASTKKYWKILVSIIPWIVVVLVWRRLRS